MKRRRGHGPAAAAFRRAAELTGDPALRRHRLQLAAEAATLAGLVPLAREAIDEAESLQPDPRQQAELGFLQGLLLSHNGEDATSAFALAGRSIADEHPERAALMLAWASEAAIYRRNWEAAGALASEAFRLVRGSGGVSEFWATWMEGIVLTEVGQSEAAAEVLERAIEVFREQLAGTDDPRLLANLSVALMYRDDFRGGLAAAERAASESRQQGAVPTLLFASSFELAARLVLGDWDRAQADAAEMHALALDSENRSELDGLVWRQAYVAAARGDTDRHAACEVLVDPARDPRVALCGGLIALGLEDPARAVEILAPLVTAGRADRFRGARYEPVRPCRGAPTLRRGTTGEPSPRGVRALQAPRLGGGRTSALPRAHTRLRLRVALRGGPHALRVDRVRVRSGAYRSLPRRAAPPQAAPR